MKMKKMNPHHCLAAPSPWGILTLLFLLLSSLSHQDAPSSPAFLLQNPRLLSAYIALQSWKQAISSDPKNFTSNWLGPNVCTYQGVFCAQSPDDPCATTVAGIDLNHAGIAGYLPEELGLLTDLALFHINSNRFYGTLPFSFSKLHLLHELDVSNNLFSGQFPAAVLCLPSLRFLDLRFNQFAGMIPHALFDLNLDALFLNNNNFQSNLPLNFGHLPASVVVLANNELNGFLPASIGKMGDTLNEIILSNTGIGSCLPAEIGMLKKVTVFDVSFNSLAGTLPEPTGEMKSLEQLNVGHNRLSGKIPASVCSLPRLQNFTYSQNYFTGVPAKCRSLPAEDDRGNCILGRPLQRSPGECAAFYSHPVDCGAFVICSNDHHSLPPSPSPPPPSYHHDP